MDSARFLVKKGFTLIELLIVIAILGVLAVVILIAINPVQQLARTRDAGRINGVQQLGHALEAYATFHNGTFVDEAGTGCTAASWVQCLVDAGEITSAPSGVSYISGGTIVPCTTNVVNTTWCYNVTAAGGVGPIIVYASLEASANTSRCPTGSGEVPFAVYSTDAGRGGLVCALNEASIPLTGVVFQ